MNTTYLVLRKSTSWRQSWSTAYKDWHRTLAVCAVLRLHSSFSCHSLLRQDQQHHQVQPMHLHQSLGTSPPFRVAKRLLPRIMECWQRSMSHPKTDQGKISLILSKRTGAYIALHLHPTFLQDSSFN